MTDSRDTLEGNIELIGQLIDRERISQAKEILERALPGDPDSEKLLYYSAYLDYRDDKTGAAHETLQRLLSINPASLPGRVLLVDVLEDRKDLAGAERVLIGVLKDYPENAHLYACYSILMLKTLHVEKAGQLAAHSVSLDPDNDSGLLASIFYKLVSDPTIEAEAELHELVQRYPDALPTAIALVSVLKEKGQYKEAYTISQELLKQCPDDDEIVDMVVGLKAASHWSMKPLAPFMRWGWSASIAVWFVVVFGFSVIDKTPLAPLSDLFLYAVITFVVYSWVYPPILRKILRR